MLQSSLPAVAAGVVAAWLIDRKIRRSVLPMLVAVAVPGLLVLGVLGVLGALPAFSTDTVTYTFQGFGSSQALPFPSQPALLHDTSFCDATLRAVSARALPWLVAVTAPVAAAG